MIHSIFSLAALNRDIFITHTSIIELQQKITDNGHKVSLMKLTAGCGITVGNAAFTIIKIIPQ